ncbi:MAG: DUF3604 domain-containing protein [Acidobacteria bacterium]|nr:DUF3604 domain-containing protein [Acidobacteriota bacterium]
MLQCRSRRAGGIRPAPGWLPLFGIGLLAAACAGDAPETDEAPAAETAAPEAGGAEPERNPLRNAYFGDFHVHSSWSLDSYVLGGNRDDPSLAYRFGRGEEVTKANGTVHRLRVPLDFMAVTDHDTWLGKVHLCNDESDAAYATPTCEQLRANDWFGTGAFEGRGRRSPDICGQLEATMTADNKCYERARHLWQDIQRNADAFYEPGVFTTFPAYEWTATPARYGHLHRNVIFRGDAVPEWGGGAVEMENRPERLWEWLEVACTGDCQVVAIPHNPNLSGGLAFDEFGWTPFTTEMLRLRAWAEPLVEIHQIKGNSECYRGLGTTDEDCNFENYYPVCEPGQRSGCAHAPDYVRNALKTGLRLEADFGVNPFKFGFIASPDDHQSLPGATDEDDFTEKPVKFGTGGGLPLVGQALGGAGWWDDREDGGNRSNPGGLVGVWAEANTRDAIFDALRRRETFGNSGTRIHVRFFAGWDYPADLDTRRDMLEAAYAGGVPMGGDLPEPPGGDAGSGPRFVVWAMKDPNSANLQKVQIVKGWAAPDGQTAEQVYDVACSDGLEPDQQTRRCADNGATVDLSDCSYPTGLGAAELSTTWTDPDFDPALRAFYYVRVLENPTCRWTTHRALARGVAPPPSDPPAVKERAWSSPIWYTPAAR